MNRQIGRTLPEGMSESMTYDDSTTQQRVITTACSKRRLTSKVKSPPSSTTIAGGWTPEPIIVLGQTSTRLARIVNYKYDALGRSIEVNDFGRGVNGGLTPTNYDTEGRFTPDRHA
ncbi:MAG: hypothetical protein AAF328_10450 [Planctomycetota bacterium]